MALYLALVMAILGGGESPLTLLARFTSSDAVVTPAVGAISHLATSAIYGALFAMLWRLIARRGVPARWALFGGITFGVFLFAFAELVLLPAVGSPLLGIPPMHFGISHVIFGLVLGALTARGHHA